MHVILFGLLNLASVRDANLCLYSERGCLEVEIEVVGLWILWLFYFDVLESQLFILSRLRLF